MPPARCIFAIPNTKGDQTQIQITQIERGAKKIPGDMRNSLLVAQVSADAQNYFFVF